MSDYGRGDSSSSSSSSSSSTNEFQDIVMSDYEKIRNENLERNAQMLKDIGFPTQPEPEPNHTLKIKKVKEVIVEEVDSKRQSGRKPKWNPERICRACNVYIGNCRTDAQKAMAGN
jgi:hypothetical protein